jgi:signal transduction histidine kinase
MGGTGLGLAIVKHIINRHRGALEIDSVVGEGSIFTVHLPAFVEQSKSTRRLGGAETVPRAASAG